MDDQRAGHREAATVPVELRCLSLAATHLPIDPFARGVATGLCAHGGLFAGQRAVAPAPDGRRRGARLRHARAIATVRRLDGDDQSQRAGRLELPTEDAAATERP